MTPEEIEKIAYLARLAIASPQELAAYTQSLSEILELIDQLTAIDTTAVAPMSHPMDAVQRLREDEVTEPDQSELLQSIAPYATMESLYLVPQVIDE